VDLSNLDITLQTLVSRIEQLQRERDEYRDELTRLKKKMSQTHTTINKRETYNKTIEENLVDVEEGMKLLFNQYLIPILDKRALESNLAQAKSLIRSQEETLKQRDEERRQLKSKMTAAELQARGKDAQIRNLNVSTRGYLLDFNPTFSGAIEQLAHRPQKRSR
jgi:chromosome segregation ATPase